MGRNDQLDELNAVRIVRFPINVGFGSRTVNKWDQFTQFSWPPYLGAFIFVSK